MANQLPLDIDSICMLCKTKPSEEQTLYCKTCTTPWHLACLSSPPESLASTLQWDCPDCSFDHSPAFVGSTGQSVDSGDLVAAIRAIEADESLTENEKAKKRQQLLSKGKGGVDEKERSEENDVLDLLDENFNCSFCMKLPERPVTTPCGHNFCLKCFQKWIGQGKHSCAKCRTPIPAKMSSQPRINASLVVAIRMAKASKSISSGAQGKVFHFVHNQLRPDKAYTTDRAKRAGKANACSGKIFVTVPPDHFGPILAENDPDRKQGVLVGECWEDRMECRQWGAHLPHVAGIAGQSEYGAQSVALSGGYEDDEDHGEWFLYTGSGGRDLSGNKRTNKAQSFDQKFEKLNEALRVSCKKGYPVRVVRDDFKEKNIFYTVGKGDRVRFWEDVWIGETALCREFGDFYAMSDRKKHPIRDFIVVENDIPSWDIDLRQVFNDWEIEDLAKLLARLGPPPLLTQQEDKKISAHDAKELFQVGSWSHKEKRSSYAPEKGVRYDGVYRIEKCWRKIGVQGFKVCRYLFVRCDNEPAPWTSDEHGDRPRPLPSIKELKAATDVTERKEGPSWGYDEEHSCWKWKKPPPFSKKSVNTGNPEDRKRARKAIRQGQNLSVREKLLKEFSCLICRKVLNLPLTTPCAHNFCKPCLEDAFCGQTFVKERTGVDGRTLRATKNIMKCPACSTDIADFLKKPQVNRELMGLIECLQRKTEEETDEDLIEENFANTDEQCETVDEGKETGRQDGTDFVQNPSELKPKQVYKRKVKNEDNETEKHDDTKVVQNPPGQKPNQVYTRRKVNKQSEIPSEDSETENQDSRKDVQNPSKHKPNQVYKRRKFNNEALLSKVDSEENTETSSEESEAEPVTEGMEDNEMEVENSTDDDMKVENSTDDDSE